MTSTKLRQTALVHDDVLTLLTRDKRVPLDPGELGSAGTRVVRYAGPKYVARYTQIISQWSAWALLITIVVLSWVPAQDRPVTGLPHLVEHLVIFAATGLAFGIGYPRRRVFQFMVLLAFTGAIELVQLLVSGRHARLSDFLIDACGISAGLLIGFVLTRDNSRAEPERPKRRREASG